MSAVAARFAVIGGGISGLCAARALAGHGVAATVYESRERAGGVLGTVSDAGYRFETAANGFLPAEGGAIELAHALGVPMAPASPAARNRWIYVGGRLHAVPVGPIAAARSELLSLRGKLRLLAEPLSAGPPEGDESIGDFGRRRLGPEATQKLLAPMVTGIYAGDIERLSLRATFPTLALLDAEGGLVRGLLFRALRGRGSATRTAKGSRRIESPVGGVGALVDALALELDGVVALGREAREIRGDGGRAVVVDADGTTESYDRVILAAPAADASALFAKGDPLRSLLAEFDCAPIAIAHLGFARADVPHPLDGFGFLVAPGESLRVLGCVFESVLWPDRAPDGGVLLRCMFGGARDRKALELSDDELVTAATTDLGHVLGIGRPPEVARVVRWPRAIAQYGVGHLGRVDRAEELADGHGVVLTGSSYRGVSVNDCIANAGRAARRALAAAAVALVIAACGGKSKPAGRADDGGSARGEVTAEAEEIADPDFAGKVVARAMWLWPPARYRKNGTFNDCGEPRRAAMRVHLMGGVHDAVLEVPGQGESDPLTEVIFERCIARDRVVVVAAGGRVLVSSTDEREQVIRIERIEGGTGSLELPLRQVGHRYAFDAGEPGVLRLSSSLDPQSHGYVYVSDGSAAVAGQHGSATLENLPTGELPLKAWHPPVEDGEGALTVTGRVTVPEGKGARVDLPLGGGS